MSQDIVQNATINNYLEEDVVQSHSNDTSYVHVSWMLKIILLQLSLCCFLTVCYIGIKIRIQKLNKNKKQIEDEITNEKNLRHSHSITIQALNGKNDAIDHETIESGNNSGGISTFAMPPNTEPLTHTMTTNTNTNKNENTNNNTNTNSNSRYNIKQLMNKMIKPMTKNDKDDKSVIEIKKTEIEMSAYNYDFKHSIDGPLSMKSTYANNQNMFVPTNRTRIDTDYTFPSIPNESDIDNEQSEGIITKNTCNTAPTPAYNFYNVGTPESSVYNKLRTSSYVQVCEQCGNTHVNNDNDASCSILVKYEKNKY
eukprot:435107_1